MRENNKHKRMNVYNRANNRGMRVHSGGMGLNNEHKRKRNMGMGMNNDSVRPNNRLKSGEK